MSENGDSIDLLVAHKFDELKKMCTERHMRGLKRDIHNNDFKSFQQLWCKGPDNWYFLSECLILCLLLNRFSFIEEIVGFDQNLPLLIDLFEHCEYATNLFPIFVKYWEIKQAGKFLEWMSAFNDDAVLKARLLLQKRQYAQLVVLIEKEGLEGVRRFLRANNVI